MNFQRKLSLFLALAGVLLLGACSTVDKALPDHSADYEKSTTVRKLDVPPDLNSSGLGDTMAVPPSASSADYDKAQNTGTATPAVLPKEQNMRIVRDGDKRWLVVNATPAALWERINQFWQTNGFLIKRDNPKIGIIETDWAENRADIPDGPIRKLVSKVFANAYSAATRDKFRVRLERGVKPGTTEIYLTHYGLEEVAKGDNTMWQARPSDPELEAEMLTRLMVYLGANEKQARKEMAKAPDQAQSRVQLVRGKDGAVSLSLDDGFANAWRITGLALDRVGFTVEDRNRSEGIYYVRYHDPRTEEDKSFFSKLAFWRSDKSPEGRYEIRVKQQGSGSTIRVANEKGQPEHSETAERILTLLQEQLK